MLMAKLAPRLQDVHEILESWILSRWAQKLFFETFSFCSRNADVRCAQKKIWKTSFPIYQSPRKALRWKSILNSNPGLSNALLANRLGTSRVRVTQHLNLLRLPIWSQKKLLTTQNLTERAIRPLIQIQNKRVFKAAFQALLNRNVTLDRWQKCQKLASWLEIFTRKSIQKMSPMSLLPAPFNGKLFLLLIDAVVRPLLI